MGDSWVLLLQLPSIGIVLKIEFFGLPTAFVEPSVELIVLIYVIELYVSKNKMVC